jgi:WD40 repeat protein
MLTRIFSRTRVGGNKGLATAIASFWVSACVPPATIPANVILPDAHSSGTVMAFAPSSDRAASGGTEGTIRLWHLPEGRELGRWRAHDGSVEGLVFLARDQGLLSAGYDADLARWDLAGQLRQRYTTPSPITHMVADESANLILTGHRDGHVRRWRLTDLSPREDLALHRAAVHAVAWHAPSRRLASSGADGKVYVVRQGEAPAPLVAAPTDAHDLAFSPDGRWLMGSGWFRLFQWNLKDASLKILRTEHHGLIRSIQYSRDGRRLFTISRQTDSAVAILDAQTGAVIQRFQPHDLCGTHVRLSPDERFLATTSDDASVRFWDLAHLLPARTSD